MVSPQALAKSTEHARMGRHDDQEHAHGEEGGHREARPEVMKRDGVRGDEKDPQRRRDPEA